MILDVMDYVELWPQFEIREDAGFPPSYRREIYSDAFGGGSTEIPDPVKRVADVNSITVWSVYRTSETWVSSLRIAYGEGAEAVIDDVGKPPASDAVQEGPVQGALREILVDTGSEINPQRYARIYGIRFIPQAGSRLDSGTLNPSRWQDAAHAESIPVPIGHHISSVHATGRPGFIDTIYLGFRRNPHPSPSKIDIFFQQGGDRIHWPETRLTLLPGWKILGGGAKVNWSGHGNMLTASYPVAPGTWIAKAKDHGQSDESNIDVWAIGIYDPGNEWDVSISSNESGASLNRPYVGAILGHGYVLTGGGAFVHWNKAGNILTASYPEPGQNAWSAASKAPDDNEECRITAYAIGLRHGTGAVHIRTKVFDHEGGESGHPTAEVAVEDGYTLVGGGARVAKYKKGNYLTASYPDFQKRKWIANSKDHLAGHADPTTIIAYAIGLEILQ
jgi:hypothetical protein